MEFLDIFDLVCLGIRNISLIVNDFGVCYFKLIVLISNCFDYFFNIID